MDFTEKHKEILFGCLLGDCSLQTFSSGKSWRARFIQGHVHKDYIFHLYFIFEPWVNTPPKSIIDKNGYQRWYFNTTTQLFLNEFGDAFYDNKRKIIPTDAFCDKLLSPLALSYWFMDDGSLKSNSLAYYLCTDSFSLQDLERLRVHFYREWDINISFHKQRENLRIYIPRKDFYKFKDLIEKNIVPSMRYKLTH